MKEILVTGSSGFIGSHLAKSLKENGYHTTQRNLKAKVWILMAGLMGNEGLKENIKNNFLSTIDFLNKAKILPQKIIYVSSIDVYSMETYYAASKLATEFFLRVFCKQKKIKLIILRPSQVYGPNDKGKKVIPKFTKAIKNGKPIKLINKGLAKRKYLFVSDLVDLIVKLVKQDVVGTFDIVGPEIIRVKDVVQVLEKAMGKKANIKDLKFKPKVKFRQGIGLTLKKK